MNKVLNLIKFYKGKGFIQKSQKRQTLTNSDLYSIAIKLKIKLNGIYMKDVLPSDLKEGNYIINLQNHDETGSHWTCFIKDKNNSFGGFFFSKSI